MYYITNQTGEIIAADSDLLALLEAKDLRDLYKKVALEEIAFLSPSTQELILQTHEGDSKYQTKQSKLSSILGELTVIHILEEVPAVQQTETAVNVPIEENITLLLADDHANEEVSVAAAEEVTEALPNDDKHGLDIDIGKLLKEAEENSECNEGGLLSVDATDSLQAEVQPTNLDQSESEGDNESADKNELFDLLLPDKASETIGEIANPSYTTSEAYLEAEEPNVLEIFGDAPEAEPEDNAPIEINITTISKKIGITPEDYTAFLNEYIDTALSLEKDLQSRDEAKRNTAIKTLSHLTDVLHLPKINTVMDAIGTSDETSLQKHIASLYSTLSRLTTTQEETLPLQETMEEEVKSDEEEADVSQTPLETPSFFAQDFGSIVLEDIQPVHFDFRLEEAADDLGLPVELIEEFVNDFILQAKEETPKMLEAYKRGELETIQKIGHLLKGAASNLRITPLAETLYEIQFCNDSSQLEPLIKNYWAHFLSFEKQMNTIS